MFPPKLLSQFAALVIGGVYKEVDKSIFGREDNWVLISFPFFKQIFDSFPNFYHNLPQWWFMVYIKKKIGWFLVEKITEF